MGGCSTASGDWARGVLAMPLKSVSDNLNKLIQLMMLVHKNLISPMRFNKVETLEIKTESYLRNYPSPVCSETSSSLSAWISL